MAYGRKTYRRRFHRRPVVSKKVKKYVKKAIISKAEHKISSSTLITNFNSVGNAWVELDTTILTQGVPQSQRIGNSINVTSLGLRGVLVGGQANVATDDNRNVLRMVVAIWDGRTATPLATNGATISSILRKDLATGNGLIKILCDRTFVLTSPGRDSTGYMPYQKYIKFYKKIMRKIDYTTTVNTTSQRKIIISMITDSAAVPHPGFVTGTWQLNFTDN